LDHELSHRRQRKIVRPKGPTILLSVREIARRYRFHENTVRRWVSEDELKSVRYGPGNKIYIAEKDVEEFLKKYYEY
jgi:excisionase family DNA binding protein